MTELTLANSEIWSHDCNLTKFAATEIPTPYLLGKFGTNGADVAICGAEDFPIGIITDTAAAPTAVGVKEPVNVALLGSPNTLLAVASEAIGVGDMLIVAAEGKVASLPATEGTYSVIGMALTAAGSGQRLEFMSCIPHQYTVITNTQ